MKAHADRIVAEIGVEPVHLGLCVPGDSGRGVWAEVHHDGYIRQDGPRSKTRQSQDNNQQLPKNRNPIEGHHGDSSCLRLSKSVAAFQMPTRVDSLLPFNPQHMLENQLKQHERKARLPPRKRQPLRPRPEIPENPSEFKSAPLANLRALCRSGLVPKKGMTSQYAESPVIHLMDWPSTCFVDRGGIK